MKQLFTLFSFLLLPSLTGYGQITYGTNINLGIGQTINHFPGGGISDKSFQHYKFNREGAFKIGSDIGYRFTNLRFLVGTGADLSYISSSFMYLPIADNLPLDSIYLDKKFDNYRVLINIPFTIYHIYEKWLWIYAGITNKFGIINNIFDYGFGIKENNYNIEYNLGVDFIINEKYKLGINYNRDINMQFEYLGRMVSYDYYKWHQAYIKLGYIIK